jgi:hypothetical protein
MGGVHSPCADVSVIDGVWQETCYCIWQILPVCRMNVVRGAQVTRIWSFCYGDYTPLYRARLTASCDGYCQEVVGSGLPPPPHPTTTMHCQLFEL